MDPDSVENLEMADKLKIVDFYKECVYRMHSDILRLQRLGNLLTGVCTNEKSKMQIEKLVKTLAIIYLELEKIL